MEYRRLGSSGLTVSAAALGCNNFGWRIGEEESAAVVRAALDEGVTFFDTADVYGGPGGHGLSEGYLGAALLGERDRVVIGTKFGMSMEGKAGALPPWETGASRRYLRSAVEHSLRRLKTDRIDLLQLHAPDPYTPIDETLSTLDDLVREGKVLYFGAGGRKLEAWHYADMVWASRHLDTIGPISAQVEWSLLHRDHEETIITACAHYGLSIIPFFPLAAGMLAGKYTRGGTVDSDDRLALPGYSKLTSDTNFSKVERLAAVASESGVTLTDLALGWLAGRPEVGCVISGASCAEHVVANTSAVSCSLTPDVVEAIEEITRVHERMEKP